VVCDGPRGRIPLYGFPENAAVALSAAYRYAAWRKRPTGSALSLDGEARREIRTIVDRVLASSREPVWLEPTDLARILRLAGIEFAAAEETSLEKAAAVGERLGYPLVVKVQAEGIIHKSDVGGVMLDLNSRAEVEAAIAAMKGRMKDIGVDLKRVLLQREIRGGIEALAGVTVDANFGPMLVCGMGGVLVEVIKDVAFRLPPVSDIDAAEMIGKLRAGILLDGYRGAPAGDRGAFAQVLQRVSALLEIIPELQDLDLNPIKVLAPGKGAIVVDGRMRLGG
jgi:acetate---CoA ligase (ADP-forming)